MRFTDAVYGPSEIDEPVLLALLESEAVQRLRHVLQHGISGFLGLTAPTTRYAHSVGVMLLVRRLGGSLDEQIAALLHDVSHTAFSHVVDYVFNDSLSQAYHDRYQTSYIAGSDIPAILAAHGYPDWEAFTDETRFRILEQPAPALCADRLDYFLRDTLGMGLSTPADVADVLAHVTLHDGRIVVDDLGTARWMAETYMAADDRSWANFREVGLYLATATAIRAALDHGIIAEADLWGTDAGLWAALSASEVPALQAAMKAVSLDTRFVWDEASPDYRVSTKLRTLDPDVWHNGELKRLSVHDADYARRRRAYLARKQGPWPIRVLLPDARLRPAATTPALGRTPVSAD